LILNGIILRTRPAKSAAAYQGVWSDEGSPLLHISRALGERIRERIQQQGHDIPLVTAMRYGSPSIPDGLAELEKAGVERLLVLPLYPQYSATTTASTFDAVAEELSRWRRIPEVRFINQYHDESGYIGALANSVTGYWQEHGRADRLLVSFHGIPQRYADQGDPYPKHCERTALLLAEALGLEEGQWQMSFQSRFGKEPWLKPYTDETLKEWGAQKVSGVHVICPGFPADCLETIEEIGEENRDYFKEAGGGAYAYIPALNTADDHAEMLANLAVRHCGGWL
jgi:ferrochelatase